MTHGIAQIIEAVRSHIWDQVKTGGPLAAIGVKSATYGSWDYPTDSVSSHLPAIIVQYSGGQTSMRSKPRGIADIEHSIDVDFLRFLGGTESKNQTLLSSLGQIADIFLADAFATAIKSPATKLVLKQVRSVSIEMNEALLLDDGTQIEYATVNLILEYQTGG